MAAGAGGGCPGNTWLAGDSTCYSGPAFAVQFDFDGPELPNQIIYGLSFNTQTYGAAPYGAPGPYSELGLGINIGGSPSVGSRALPDTAYISDTGFLHQDTGWSPFSAAVSFSAVPEPGTAGLLLGAAIVIGIGRRRARGLN